MAEETGPLRSMHERLERSSLENEEMGTISPEKEKDVGSVRD